MQGSSKFVVGQKLDLIIDIVKQRARTQLIPSDRLEVQHILIVVTLESHRLVFEVGPYTYDFSLGELECLRLSKCTLMELFWSAFMLFQLPPLALTI